MLGIYITAGYPNLQTTINALKILDESDVDLIELGVPFSDPMADGPVIQQASHTALLNGTNLDEIFKAVNQARSVAKPRNEKKGLNNLILFSYFNPLFIYGFDKLISKCKENQIAGVLIPDLPLEEAEALCEKFQLAKLDLILLASITSTQERLEKISKLSNPWIYLVSRTGVTGSSADIKNLQANQDPENDSRVSEIIKKLKNMSNKPIALGFGIDSAEKVKTALDGGADIAIIGSKAVKVLAEEGLECFDKFIDSLQAPLNVL
jgi:tryptophan synthase alpha chain